LIRRSSTAEAESHFAVQRAACVAGLPHIYPPELYPFPDEEIRRRWRDWSGTTLVCEHEGRVVGVAGVERCWLHGLYVLPEHWGTGVADELHAAALAEQRDCAELRLWVLEANARARRFYERHGWRPNGETRVVPYPPHPLDVGYTYIREEP
jgi:GNAT superfamily N-acetyltransferase